MRFWGFDFYIFLFSIKVMKRKPLIKGYVYSRQDGHGGSSGRKTTPVTAQTLTKLMYSSLCHAVTNHSCAEKATYHTDITRPIKLLIMEIFDA